MITTNRKFDSLTSANPLLDAQTSFMLLRTNPAITGNVKLTIDSSADIWLNSFDANATLSDIKYKRFALQANSSYAMDLKTFFDNGSTPASIVYQLYQADTTYLSTKRNLHQQFDNFYCAGADQLTTKLYTEDFSFLAPLWLRPNLPDYFIIMRMEEPFSTIDREKINWNEIVNTSEIIKTFDLSANSNIGKYMRGIVNDGLYPISPLQVNFDSQSLSSFNGIAYDKGVYTNRGELLYNYFLNDRTTIEFDDYITQGFQRNSMISANMLNLEFLFDDNEASNYSINRYWGVYVSANELANFETSVAGLKFDTTSNQTPVLDDIDLFEMAETQLLQSNPDGAIVWANANKLAGSIQLGLVELNNQLFYLRDKLNTLYTVKSIDTWETDTQESTFFESTFRLHLQNENIDYAKFIGKDLLTIQGDCEIIEVKTSAQKILTFTSVPQIDDFIEIEWKNGQSDFVYRVVVNDLCFVYDIVPISFTINTITLDQDYSLQEWSIDWADIDNGNGITTYPVLSIQKDNLGRTILIFDPSLNFVNIVTVSLSSNHYYWEYPQLNPDIKVNYTYINNRGSIQDTLGNFVNAFNSFEFRQFYVVVYNETLIFQTIEPGSWGNGFVVRFPLTVATAPGTSVISSVFMLDTVTLGVYDATPCVEYRLEGGTENIGSVIKVDTQTGDQILQYLDNYASTVEGYAKILGVYPYLQEPVMDIDVDSLVASYANIDSYYTINLTSDLWYLNDYGEFTLYTKTKPSFGVLSIFPIKDFDIDFYSENYGKNLSAEVNSLFRNFNPGEILLPNAQYYVEGSINLYSIDSQYVNIKSYSPYNVNNGAKAYFIINGDYTQVTNQIFDVVSFQTQLADGNDQEIEALIDQAILINGGTQTQIILSTDKLNYSNIFNLLIKVSSYYAIYGGAIGAGENFQIEPGTSVSYFTDNLAFPQTSMVILDLLALDEDLNSFKGFAGLSDFITLADEVYLKELFDIANKSVEQRNSDRQIALTWKQLRSEYFKLQENFVKNYALNSRVVPYILKWALKNGKDVRDNPYRFNVSRNFGISNFSPLQIRLQSPESFSHEWFYLDHVPANLQGSDLSEVFNYFFAPFDSLQSLAIAGNSQYYLTSGYPLEQFTSLENQLFLDKYQPVASKISDKFSIFEYDPNIQTITTFFKGIRFQISELIAGTNQIQLNSQKYDEYTFSIIMKEVPYVFESNAPQIAYKVIEYTASSHIQFVIEYAHVDYRSIVDYLSLYSTKSKKKFDPTGEFLVYDDHRLSAPLSLGRPSSQLLGGLNYIKIIPHEIIVNDTNVVIFETNLFEELLQNSNGKFTSIIDTVSLPNNDQNFASIGVRFPDDIASGVNLFDIELTHLATINDSLTVIFPSGNIYKSVKGANNFSPRDAAFNQDEYWAQSYSVYYNGGKGVNAKILNRVSFAEIENLINSNDTQIQYQSFDENGLQTTGNFQLAILDPHSITKVDILVPTPDLNKPEILAMIPIIGYVLNRQSDSQLLYRYGGNYEPIFRNVVEFALTENQNLPFTYYRNTTVIEDDNFGIIQNMFINKIADSEILRIPQNVAFPSEYPLINEISIDKKDMYIFDSNWNTQFYQKYQSISNFTYTDGANDIQEFKTFLGSKLMKTEYALYFQGLGNVSLTGDITQDCLISGNVTLEFLFTNRLINYFLNSGVLTMFQNYEILYPGIWGSSTYLQKATDYITTNILNLYALNTLSIYTRALKTGETPYQDSLDEEGLLVNGYVLDKTVIPTTISAFDYQITKNIVAGSPLNITAIITFQRI